MQVPWLSGRLVLVADDNPFNQEVAHDLLREARALVEVAGNGAEAVAMARQADYDLVLMDIQMPVMDGLEASRRLRAAGRQGPIIALSASVLPGTRDRCLAAGMDDLLIKPIDRDQFLIVVGRWLAGTAADAEPSRPKAVEAWPVSGRVARLFRDNHGSSVERIGEALVAGDTVAARRLAHDLGSAAAVVGAERLVRLARTLEALLCEALEAGRAPVVAERLPLLAQALAAALDALPCAEATTQSGVVDLVPALTELLGALRGFRARSVRLAEGLQADCTDPVAAEALSAVRGHLRRFDFEAAAAVVEALLWARVVRAGSQ